MSTPDIDTLTAAELHPSYPRERVERVLAACGHPKTWEAFAVAARDRGWEAAADAGVSLYALRFMAWHAATPEQRRCCVLNALRLAYRALVNCWSDVSPTVADIHRRLLAWEGDYAEILAILQDARDAYDTHRFTYAVWCPTQSARIAYEAAYYGYVVSDTISACIHAEHVVALVAYYSADDRGRVAEDRYSAAWRMAEWDTLLFVCRLLDGLQPEGSWPDHPVVSQMSIWRASLASAADVVSSPSASLMMAPW